MKHIIITLSSILLLNSSLFSQTTIENVLSELEQNNTGLSALRKSVEAEKIGHKTGRSLANPEVEFDYLWGDPKPVGNRVGIAVSQSFDFPTAYTYKAQIAKFKDAQLELEYTKQLKSLFLKGRVLCHELIYSNALQAELDQRLSHAQDLAKAYQSKFDLGEANVLENNKAQLNLLNSNQAVKSNQIQQEALMSELRALNGGKAIAFDAISFQMPALAVDFETWYVQAEEQSPMLNWLKQELSLQQKQVQLNRALSLPKLKAGYMSEQVTEETFRGISVGISLPLWENKNTVKYAKAQRMATESLQEDQKLQLYNRLKILYNKANQLSQNLILYQEQLKLYNHSDLLKKALDHGEINLIQYMMELSVYYESINQRLTLEKELSNTLAELNQYM